MGDDSKDRTLWCGNLHSDTTEELLYELFVQAGPLEQVKIPNGKPFAFVEFRHVESVPYAVELMKGVTLIGHQLRMQFRPGSVHEGSGRGNAAYPPNQRQHRQHQSPAAGYAGGRMGNNAGLNPQGNMVGGLMGMSPNFSSPLRPPMAGMLMNTNFHRSYSSPEFGNNGSMPGRQGYQQGGYGGSGGRDSPNQGQQRHHQRGGDRDQQHRGGGGGGGRERDGWSQHQQQSRHGQQRDSRSSERGHDRGGEDRNRKRRHQEEHEHRQSEGRSQHKEHDPKQLQKAASQNFRRQMASPPWKRTVPPWEQQ